MSADSILVTAGHVTTNGIDQLRSKGASADIMSHYVDAHGRVVDEELDARTISVDLDGVKVRDDGATVAPGLGAYWSSHPEPKKQRLWGVALRGGLCTDLVVDASVAELALG